jgi:hypothetical protein
MNLTRRNRTCLSFLEDISAVSDACDTVSYIWGGLPVDVLEGRFLREHHDIDGFTLDLKDKRGDLEESYRCRDYDTRYMDEWDILVIEKSGLQASFNRLEIDRDTAMWRHIGDAGALFFPREWLPEAPLEFCGVKVYISGIQFEYAIKTSPWILGPEWTGREKDRQAAEYLARKLAEAGICADDVLSRVWSYNPFWVRKGYSEYAMPAVASPLSPLP